MSLGVLDLAGRLGMELIHGDSYPAGDHAVIWNGLDEAGRPVSSGVYLYRLEAAGAGVTRKMTLLR